MRALLSVSDKTGVVELARGLAARGWELISTGGTLRLLADAGISAVGVSDLTGFPEMLDGRVKTLHPAVHAGILARRQHPDDVDVLARLGIRPIDLVAVNLYPFARAAADPATPFEKLIEEIDVGGPTLVRAAAKNFQDVVVLVDPADYQAGLEACDREGGPSISHRFALARKAFAHTAAYDEAIAAALSGVESTERGWRRAPVATSGFLPGRLRVVATKVRDLRYGENPHQRAAWYVNEHGLGLGGACLVQGKEPSFTNLLDLDAAARLVLEFAEPSAAIIKHTNPSGVATGASLAEAYVRARDADPLSAFGGIVGLNRPIDADTARAITSTFIEAVVAPAVDEDARAVLAAKAALRVAIADFDRFTSDAPMSERRREIRSILGGLLVQDRDCVVEASAEWPHGESSPKVVTRRGPTAVEWRGLRFAWRVAAHVKSNAVIFTTDDRTVAIGAGQTSRVDAVKVAKMKAGRALTATVAASDAFFPFRDGLDAIAEAGATAVIQPGGSVRDKEVIAAADEHDLAMVFTTRRHFWH